MLRKKEHKQNNSEKNHDENGLNHDFMQNEELIPTGESEEISSDSSSEIQEDLTGEETMGMDLKVAEIEKRLAEMSDKYLRLSAEFDNYRKRTLREKMELIRTANESVMQNILPIIDDFERAMKSIEKGMDFEATKEGISLIYNKFKDFTRQNGIKEIDAEGDVFNTDLHEAITKIPAPTDDLKGKIIDVVQKGYYLNDKVIRFAKVVVGE
jgi:molecular chaperone GrpE